MATIVLADDHPIVRQGIRAVLEEEPDCKVIGEAEDGLEAVEMVERLKPDVLIVDVMMPRLSGLEVTRRVCQRGSRTRVVVLSMHSNEPYVLEALRNGAMAYVLKTAPTDSLLLAVRTAIRGQRYLSPPLTERAIAVYIQSASQDSVQTDRYEMLTPREREIFHLAADGLTNSSIAERLSISPRTAETHRSNLMRKLELRSQADLLRYAMQRGIIQAR